MEVFRRTPSDPLHILCAMHNMGLISEDRSMTVEEIANRIHLPPQEVRKRLEELLEMGYVHLKKEGPIEKYYLSPEGILKVLSLYT